MKKLILLAALAIAGVGSAQAITISGGTFSNAEQTTEINQSGNLNLFDSSLGVLNSVTFDFSGSMTTGFNLTNNAANSQTVKATGTVDLFAGSSNTAIDNLINSMILGLSATTGFVAIAPGASNNYGPFTDSDSLSVTFLSGLSAFEALGGGLFDVTGFSLSGLGLTGGGGNVAAVQRTSAGIGAAITYDYTARPQVNVPEPAILGLMGLGFVAMGAMRRRRQS